MDDVNRALQLQGSGFSLLTPKSGKGWFGQFLPGTDEDSHCRSDRYKGSSPTLRGKKGPAMAALTIHLFQNCASTCANSNLPSSFGRI
ncbi:hypothetical protein AVEN_188587-1 [Araneus ventricosus]|uniref:Uncharacterized protein n=1 Tax=Araneus ventricosus TaxID=182803 RepID=A0A4Y2HRS6_ARAVE|nr:hypothetical protein AVEN_188587-1 [Araneus ventricosus]